MFAPDFIHKFSDGNTSTGKGFSALQNESQLSIYDPQPLAWLVITSIISLFGCLSYILLFVVFCIQYDVWNGSKILIVHMTVLQFSLCAIQLPFQDSVYYQAIRGSPAAISCSTALFFYVATLTATNWTALFLAILRYAASAAPFCYQRLIGRRKLLSLIALSWLLGIALNIPGAFGLGIRFTMVPPFYDCGVVPTGNGAYFPVWIALPTTFPLPATVFIYVLLFLHMRVQSSTWYRRTHVTPHPGSGDHLKQATMRRLMDRRVVVTRMLFAAELLNCLCFVPTPICIGLRPVEFWTTFSMRMWTVTVLACGYAMNPLIFIALNKDYQARIRRLIYGTPLADPIVATDTKLMILQQV